MKNTSTPHAFLRRQALLILFTYLGAAATSVADSLPSVGEAQTIEIWPAHSGMNSSESTGRLRPDRGDGHFRLTDVGTPTMLYFPATESQAPGPAVILCPGGGYKHLVITKMTPTAEWFNERGIHAFILQYRTPRMRDAAFNDAQRAMRILRARAAEWDIDPDKIGIMGSSAGGHLAARVSLHAGAPTYPPVDLIDAENGQPAFTILLYPAYMDRSDGSLRDTFRVHKDLPPTLIISARDDRNHFRSGAVYAEALEAAGAPVQTHFFDSGGHGFSMLNNPDPLSSWPDKMERWLQAIHVID